MVAVVVWSEHSSDWSERGESPAAVPKHPLNPVEADQLTPDKLAQVENLSASGRFGLLSSAQVQNKRSNFQPRAKLDVKRHLPAHRARGLSLRAVRAMQRRQELGPVRLPVRNVAADAAVQCACRVRRCRLSRERPPRRGWLGGLAVLARKPRHQGGRLVVLDPRGRRLFEWRCCRALRGERRSK